MNQMEYGMPVYNLQHMLRTVFQVRGMEPEVIPDGYFGETTQTAVKNFQTKLNIRADGIVNQETWDLLVREYDLAVIEGNDPISVQLFVREDFMKDAGGPLARVAVMQAMLQVMQKRFPNLPQVEVTGALDAQTAEAVKQYRRLFDLPEGGGLDNQLWYHFAKAYESSVLSHDFENLENNKFIPSQARQQIDMGVRGEESMSDAMSDEAPKLRQPTEADLHSETDVEMNRMPMLDSYKSLNRKSVEETIEPAQRMQEKMQNSQRKQPIKWNFK